MPRVKRGMIASKRRKKVIKAAKGYKWRRKNTFRAAKEAVSKAGIYAFRDRKAKKRTFRNLWILKINNALKAFNLKYSVFIKMLSDKKIKLDRKILSQLAETEPDIFSRIIKTIKN